MRPVIIYTSARSLFQYATEPSLVLSEVLNPETGLCMSVLCELPVGSTNATLRHVEIHTEGKEMQGCAHVDYVYGGDPSEDFVHTVTLELDLTKTEVRVVPKKRSTKAVK